MFGLFLLQLTTSPGNRTSQHLSPLQHTYSMIPLWLQAGLYGLLAGLALVVGAVTGCFVPIKQRVVAGIMAFGSGVLVSALSFELMGEAYERGGFDATVVGFLAGAAIYTFANWVLAKQGAKHRKRSGKQQPSESEESGSGMALAIGSLIDGIPEAMVIGISMIAGGAVSMVALIAVCLSNVPEGLSSAVGMKNAGRSKAYIFGVWGSIALILGFASLAGYTVFSGLPDDVIAATTALAAGAILAMVSDTMIPEAFEQAHNMTGLITDRKSVV